MLMKLKTGGFEELRRIIQPASPARKLGNLDRIYASRL
jgi:hypothetical protein